MRELRLVDPDGYSVPGVVTVVADDTDATAITQDFRAQAEIDAAAWDRDVRGYRIQDQQFPG